MVKLKLTDVEVNQAYDRLNESKEKFDKNYPAMVWLDNKELQFNFDPTVGNKGAWILATDYDIVFTSDEDYDHQI